MVACTISESNRVKEELDNLPEPTKDITDSFTDTLKENADIMETAKDDSLVDAGLLFYHNVRNQGEWDLKQFPEYQGTFSFNEITVQGQDLGNINFGYTGTALGIPAPILLLGAGYAQVRAGTSSFASVMASNGDDLRDQLFIMYGISLYHAHN